MSSGKVTRKVLSPEERHSGTLEINVHFEILPGQRFESSGIYLQRVLLKSMLKPYLSARHLILSKSDPEPPAPNV